MKALSQAQLEMGFSNDPEDLKAAQQFRLDALADGWTSLPREIPVADPPEVIDRLRRGKGWQMNVLARTLKPTKPDSPRFLVNISIWAPDKLNIKVPRVYDAALIRKLVRYCKICDTWDIDPVRFSFAGRCCAECRDKPEQRNIYMG